MKKMISLFLILIFILIVLIVWYFFTGQAPKQKNIVWGVNFSQMQTEALKLDWKKTYLAILEDLGAKNIKLLTQWDWVEGKQNNFYFNDIDWQVQQAENHDAKLIYVVGMKTGRWPECHVPLWANALSKQEQQDSILAYIKETVTRYKTSKSIMAWQAENEPLFNFGQCPWYDKDFLAKEIALIKSLDPSRQVIVSDSGEQSWWFGAAKMGDVVSTTMYRRVWVRLTSTIGFYGTFPIPPVFYYRKAEVIKYLFNKDVFCGELQAEPWYYKTFYNVSLDEQAKTMDLNQFKDNIEYAKETGLSQFYFWGTEWWYWLKTTQHQPQIWDYAKEVLKQ